MDDLFDISDETTCFFLIFFLRILLDWDNAFVRSFGYLVRKLLNLSREGGWALARMLLTTI